MSSEAAFKARLRNLLIDAGAHVHVHQGDLTPGVPDLSIGLAGHTYWLELKRALTQGKPGHPLVFDIKAEQELWLVQRGATAGRCGLAAELLDGRWYMWRWNEVPALRAKALPSERMLERARLFDPNTLAYALEEVLR